MRTLTVTRLRCAQRSAPLFLLGLILVCLVCQVYPEGAGAHHAESSAPDRVCTTVAEAAPVLPAYALVGSPVSADQRHAPVMSELALPGVLGLDSRTFHVVPQPEALFLPDSTKLYRLHCTYRL